MTASVAIPIEEIRAAFSGGWLSIRPLADTAAVATLRVDIDRGESEAIVLAREASADLLLIDDRRAREVARRQGLETTGTIGILSSARNHGLIPAVVPLLEDLRGRGFRVSTELVQQLQREETIP